jgi:CHASE2 domain-containing sensor protein
MAGIEILANVIETVWSGRFIRRLDLWARVLVLLILGVLAAVLCRRPWTGLGVAGIIAAAYLILASLLFDYQGVMVDILFPLLTVALAYIAAAAYRYSIESRRGHLERT